MAKNSRNWDWIARIGRNGARRWAEQAAKLASRLVAYRVFADSAGKMNRSVRDVGGALLLVPQFTLAADTSGGLRPSFSRAAPPETGARLFDALVVGRRRHGHPACMRPIRRGHAGRADE